MGQRLSFRARWVFPVDQPPLENGVVEFQGGMITAVHNRPGPVTSDLGNTSILPCFINCHAHLEFSALSHPLTPAQPFAEWIKSLVRYRRGLNPQEAVQAIGQGIAESRQAGCAVVGEIATTDWPLESLPAERPHLVVFREILARDPDSIPEQMARATRHLELQGTIPDTTFALSPHAPYSVHPDLFRDLVKLAAERNTPLAMHLAETTEELELLSHGTGPLVDMLRGFGVWNESFLPTGTRILEYLQTLRELSHALVIHGNYLTPEEIDLLVENPQLTLVYCPRTHAFFGHQNHPWQQVLERGGSVALGTDGRGSNPDLNLWDEVRFLRRNFPSINPATLLELATLRGARALGLEAHYGSLTPGKRFAMIPHAINGSGSDPYDLLFSSTAKPQSLP